MQRPYGCGEQTISAAYPSLMALRLHHAERNARADSDTKPDADTPPATPTIARAERYLRAGVEKLLGYRNTDGGFSFWARGASDTALTAYALQFLTDAAPFATVDETVTADARKFLIRRQQPDGHWQTTYEARDTTDRRGATLLAALVTRALAETAPRPKETPKASETLASQTSANETPADKDAREVANALKRALAFLDARTAETDEPYVLATYALASSASGDGKRASIVAERLRRLARDEAAGSYWSLETNTPFYGWGIAGRIESTALAVQVLTRSSSRADDPDTRRLIERGTLCARDG